MAKLDFDKVTMADLEGKAVVVQPITSSGNVFNLNYTRNLLAFSIHNDAVYDYTRDDKGVWMENKTPIVKLDKAKGTIEYLAGVYVEDLYVKNDMVHQEKFLGEPAVALLQALKLYLQSFQMFKFDAYLTDERKILNGLIGETVGNTTTTTTTTTSTTTTTVKPEAPKPADSTTTTTTTTVKP